MFLIASGTISGEIGIMAIEHFLIFKPLLAKATLSTECIWLDFYAFGSDATVGPNLDSAENKPFESVIGDERGQIEGLWDHLHLGRI
jgi:hypothetical protein